MNVALVQRNSSSHFAQNDTVQIELSGKNRSHMPSSNEILFYFFVRSLARMFRLLDGKLQLLFIIILNCERNSFRYCMFPSEIQCHSVGKQSLHRIMQLIASPTISAKEKLMHSQNSSFAHSLQICVLLWFRPICRLRSFTNEIRNKNIQLFQFSNSPHAQQREAPRKREEIEAFRANLSMEKREFLEFSCMR